MHSRLTQSKEDINIAFVINLEGSFNKKLPAIHQEGNKLKEIKHECRIYPSNTYGETLKNVTQMHNLFLCRREMKPKIYIPTNSNTAHTLLQDVTTDKKIMS